MLLIKIDTVSQYELFIRSQTFLSNWFFIYFSEL